MTSGDTPSSLPPSSPTGFAARTVLLGAVLGFGLLCVLGRQAARENHFQNFVRFMRWTAPDTKFYPTVGEMMAIIRAKTKPGQILVVVGGNSVLRGVGQSAAQVWTKVLQDELGDGYSVVNLAFDASGITDGAAVAAEALRKEYPRQIYIANAAPGQPPAPDGTGVYRFVFWEARAKGLLIDDPVRNAAIVASNKNPAVRDPAPSVGPGLQELQIHSYLDHLFYYRDFWTTVTYERFNTVWGAYSPGPTSFLRARKMYTDPGDDRTKVSLADRYIPANLDAEMINVRGCSEFAYGIVDATGFHEQKDPATGQWTLYQPTWTNFTEGIKGAMPAELKKRTLILMSRSSPYYLKKLTPDEQERDTLAYDHAVEMWKAGGYDSMTYGGMDFTDFDYNDRTHLTALGGNKLAHAVSAKVRDMSAKLGYLSP
jgi:hypothetical protein